MTARAHVLRFAVPMLLFVATAALMFLRLGEPDRIVFDETYYVNDAREFLDTGIEDGFAVHPPVGKWLIAASIGLVGDHPVGWRAAGALAGALSVVLVYEVGVRLFRRVGPAALAALLVATDGLFLVQARTAMLDVFLALFVVLGVLFLLVDLDRSRPEPVASRWRVRGGYPIPAGGSRDGTVEVDTPETADGPAQRTGDDEAEAPAPDPDGDDATTGRRVETLLPARSHAFRFLAGAAFGLAVATKWSGLLALGAAVLVTLASDLAWRRRLTGRARVAVLSSLATIGLAFVVVPAAVYVASYVPWFVNYAETTEGDDDCPDADETGVCDVGLVGRLEGFGRYQRAVLDFHLGLEADHPYRAPAYTWPIMARPVVYYWETCSERRLNRVPSTDPETGEIDIPDPCVVERGQAAEILAVGNPALWWGFLGAALVMVAGAVRGDRRALIVLAFWAAQFVPWLVVPRPAFFFYMVPVVPFLALGVAYAVVALDERLVGRRLALGAAVGAGVGFGAGYGFEQLVDATTSTARWFALGIGAVVGSAVAGSLTPVRRPRWRTPRLGLGTKVGIVVAVVAVGLFVYFSPVWLGVPLAEATVRQRWWFRGWV